MIELKIKCNDSESISCEIAMGGTLHDLKREVSSLPAALLSNMINAMQANGLPPQIVRRETKQIVNAITGCIEEELTNKVKAGDL